MKRAPFFIVSLALIAVSAAARGDDRPASEPRGAPTPEPRSWHVRGDVGTDAPVSIDGRVTVELPGRLRLVGAMGVLPSAYARVVNGVMLSANAYDDAAGKIVVGALSGSMVTRAHLGWRPIPGSGLYGDVGYALVFLGGAVSSGELVQALAKRIGPIDPGSYDVSATLHMLDVELGWEWTLAERLYLRTGIGASLTMGRTVRVEPIHSPFPAPVPQVISEQASSRLEHLMAQYAHLPMVTMGVGYAFF
jgi:hypothetical protein